VAHLVVGRFGKTYGIKGWLKIHSLTDPPENILNYFPWQTDYTDKWQVIEISESKRLGQQIIVKIAGCDTPEQAKLYVNLPIAIDRSQLPLLPQGEFYWIELIGLKVINEKGLLLGLVESLMETGSNDVLVIKGERTRLLPYTKEVIKEIKINEGTINVVWDFDF
jgi:16S rRNA processing protein RimM